MSQAKIKKLAELYDISIPADLFTVLPQEMETMEIKGLAKDLDGPAKKQAVMDIMVGIANKSPLCLNETTFKETLSVFIDVINSASKGKYALNKDKS
jgi:hypothetical protein